MVEVEGARLALREWGPEDGRPIFFWHALGLDASGRTIEAVAPRIANAGFHVVALDGPGFGDSPLLPSERYRLEALAQLAHRLVATLDLEPLVFMGHSWGGAVAVRYAAAHPSLVRAVVLLDSGHIDYRDLPDVDADRAPEEWVAEAAARDPRLAEARGKAMHGMTDRVSVAWPVLAEHEIPTLLLLATVDPHGTQNREHVGGFEQALPQAEVRWVEVFSHAVQLHVTPLSSAELFRRQMTDHPRAWIFTSATLAVGEDFGHFTRELGVPDAATRRWASPFDFPRQALLYVPKALPEPGEAGFTEAVIEAALPVLRASEGRAFLLFTTLRALRRAHQILEGKIDYPLLVQGTGSRSQLLSRFRALGNAVLLGSQSFWEGVDVRGEALSLVVIDKLPFAPPDDPVLAARIEGVRSAGGNPFNELQLPQAVLQLKQGAGRLIRDEADRGVLMLCDPRLVSKPYGRRILQSLPPMALTRELSAVERFFAARPAGGCG